jgi:ubiquinone/menaquinone biosynthesis C-methylase UbiE
VTEFNTCGGEGFYSRQLKHRGAERVLGVDSSQGMIELARKQEEQQHAGVEYLLSDIREMPYEEDFDLAVAAWLLNYAQNEEQLNDMCRAVAKSLKPGGRFVTVNCSPLNDWPAAPSYRKYGFDARLGGKLVPGAPITWTFYLENEAFDLENYYLSQKAHDDAFRNAGFREVRWHAPRVSGDGIAAQELGYWETFLSASPAVFIECTK